MICSISKNATIDSSFEYHEEKILQTQQEKLNNSNNEKCEFLTSSSVLEDRNLMLQELKDTVNASSLTKQKYMHLSINLPHNETCSNEKFIEIGRHMLRELGYKETPYLMYRHHDKKHQHIHILTTICDFNGKSIDTKNDYIKNVEISRKAELLFGLKSTKMDLNKNTSLSLSEIHQQQYSVLHAITKCHKDFFHSKWLTANFDMKLIKQIKDNKLTNELIKHTLRDESYNKLYTYLEQKNFIKPLDKYVLIDKLQLVYSTSKTKDDFFNNCKQNNITIHENYSNNKKELIYKDQQTGFSIKSSKIGHPFDYSSIHTIGILPHDNTAHTINRSKADLLKTELLIKLKPIYLNSNSKDEFFDQCKSKNINVRADYSNNKKTLVYKDENTGVILTSKQLGKPFDFHSVYTLKVGEKLSHFDISSKENSSTKSTNSTNEKSYIEQNKYLSNQIRNTIKHCKSTNELIEKLQEKNIDTLLFENSGGIYGVKFVSKNVDNPIQINGSSLTGKYSWNNILTIIDKNINSETTPVPIEKIINDPNFSNSIPEPFEPESTMSDFTPALPPSLKPKKHHDYDDEIEELKRKHKRNNPQR